MKTNIIKYLQDLLIPNVYNFKFIDNDKIVTFFTDDYNINEIVSKLQNEKIEFHLLKGYSGHKFDIYVSDLIIKLRDDKINSILKL